MFRNYFARVRYNCYPRELHDQTLHLVDSARTYNHVVLSVASFKCSVNDANFHGKAIAFHRGVVKRLILKAWCEKRSLSRYARCALPKFQKHDILRLSMEGSVKKI